MYRIHPLSVRELQSVSLVETTIRAPKKINDDQFDALFRFGGFPEPLITTGEKIQDLAQLEVLAELLKHQSTKQVKYTELAKKVRVADTTIRRWVKILESYYYCFSFRPWTKNISRSLLKEPKIFLWDWSVIDDIGQKVENFVACHLLKAVHYWKDMGFGKYELFFIRDKDQREVDFLIVQNGKPWVLIEVKSSANEKLSQSLKQFHKHLNTPYAFQVAFDMPYVDKDCFEQKSPCIVSLKTFLSQLV